MLGNARQISDFPSYRFKLIGFCNQCSSRYTINQDHHPKVTLDRIQKEVKCPSCHATGLKVSITIRSEKQNASKPKLFHREEISAPTL